MPAPAPSWSTVRVHGTWVNQDGSLKAGSYEVKIPVRVTNATDDVIIPAGRFAEGNLNTTNGLPSLDLQIPATDDPDNLPAFQVQITVAFPDADVEHYQIDVPIALQNDANGIDLRAVVLDSTFTPTAALIRGVPGGIAGLDAAGRVVDADGNVVSGSGGGVTSYIDLTDKPTLGTAASQPISAFDAAGSASAAQAATRLALARNPDQLISGAITRDANGAATSAPVTWPDGAPGTYTALTVSTAFPGAVDAYTITYGSPVTKTYTQPAVTRDSTSGAVTNAPAVTVA